MTAVDPESSPKPCDYFDMIGGTSTSGLIAIMLGRLHIVVDECIYASILLSANVLRRRAAGLRLKESSSAGSMLPSLSGPWRRFW